MLNEKVARLRQLMRDAVPIQPPAGSAAESAARAFAYYDFNTAPPLEQSQRARAMRTISRIATWYGLGAEVARALDAAQACTLNDLDDEAVDRVLTRMQQLEQCVQEGLDPPDSPVAR